MNNIITTPKINFNDAQRLATIFSGLIRNATLYPPGNPALTRPLNDLHKLVTEQMRAGSKSIRMGLADEILFVEEHLFVTAPPSIEELAILLASRKIDAIIIMQEVEADNILQLAKLLSDKSLSTQMIIKQLEEAGNSNILVISSEDTGERLLQEAGNAYQQALDSIRSAFSDIEQHRIPSSERLLAATRQFTDIAVQDPVIVGCLGMIKDYDNYTFNHSVNVGVIAMSLAAYLKYDRQSIEEAGIAGFLHDVGKTMVPKTIINKPGKLTVIEFNEIKKHPEDGVKIIEKMSGLTPAVSEAVLGHHLRYNRKGYPEWAQGKELSKLNEIIAVADCFDACTTLRVYQQPMPPAVAINLMKGLGGDSLNPDLVNSFATMMGKYPPGTVVRLNNNELALVWRVNMSDPEHPHIRVIFDASGNRIDTPITEKLGDRKERGMIVAVIDPLTKGIEVGEYFRQV
jgi:putative nucleotidyltransferase with HDIG domain